MNWLLKLLSTLLITLTIFSSASCQFDPFFVYLVPEISQPKGTFASSTVVNKQISKRVELYSGLTVERGLYETKLAFVVGPDVSEFLSEADSESYYDYTYPITEELLYHSTIRTYSNTLSLPIGIIHQLYSRNRFSLNAMTGMKLVLLTQTISKMQNGEESIRIQTTNIQKIRSSFLIGSQFELSLGEKISLGLNFDVNVNTAIDIYPGMGLQVGYML